MMGPRRKILEISEEWSESSYALLRLGWELFTDSITIFLLVVTFAVFVSASVAENVKILFKLLEFSLSTPIVTGLLIASVILRSIGKRIIGTRIHEKYIVLDILTSLIFILGGIIGMYVITSMLSSLAPSTPFEFYTIDLISRLTGILLAIPITGAMMIVTGITINGFTRFINLVSQIPELISDIREEIGQLLLWATKLNNIALKYHQIRRYAANQDISKVHAVEQIISNGLETVEPMERGEKSTTEAGLSGSGEEQPCEENPEK